MPTTIKLDRLTRILLDDYAAAACALRRSRFTLVNADGVKERISTYELANRMDKYLIKVTFEEIFPGYILQQYNVDTGVATVELAGEVSHAS